MPDQQGNLSEDAKPVKGSCLCGKVAYEIRPPFLLFRYCCCPRCQKASGSAHVANLFLTSDQFHWTEGADYVVRYDLPEAKRFSTCFCKICGSPLPRISRDGVHVVVPAGSLDEDPGIAPGCSIFWDYRAPWYREPAEMPKFPGYPPESK